ncbi:hypothetical protein, partial [Moorena sp. SIO1G6]|uniref:hypothetical protein n=1 Tax=Moorena sp. SIO1G6 TaxID=2607840 RepID=UPI00257ACBC3
RRPHTSSTLFLDCSSVVCSSDLIFLPLLPTPYSRLPTPASRLPTPDSRLPTPDSRLPTPDSRLPKTHKSNSSNKSTRT